ncbi:MAG: regulatory iron-sulfur-containing complex subunit RicT [Chitinophagales bacterium]
MGCAGCSTGNSGGAPAGCKSNGHCATGGCNKLNTYDWLSFLPVPVGMEYQVYEVSFKNGIRKGFYNNANKLDVMTGDLVAVETDSGFDVGRISLSGELVKLQMKKKKVHDTGHFPAILRLATENDITRMMEGRAMEGATMLKSRKLARELGLDMKIGEVEYQGDKRKATFYYIADDRVDFRELIKVYAREFKVKIEMRQIGARQEAGKIGGLGSCGRELCCSTWLTDFKSVGTNAARYQNLSINQSKLSGQCGRLKCCLNYELDTYMDALQDFPKKADYLKTKAGDARLIKTDIFKKLMVYEYRETSKQFPLTIEKVVEILDMNERGELPEHLDGFIVEEEAVVKEVEYATVIEQVSLKSIEKASQKRKKQQNKNRNRDNKPFQKGPRDQNANPQKTQGNQEQNERKENRPQGSNPNRNNQNNPNRNNKNRRNRGNRNNPNNKNNGNA